MSQTATAPPTQARSGPGGAPHRTDIQGLRAVAVSLVLVFHLWPGSLTGGFVGVDVFFVISGFLITSHLVSHPPRTARDLATFWSRRIRRLLPASLLVLAATLIATRVVAPETVWLGTAEHVRGAALYVVNWLLASDSIDYLAADNAPSAVQHFWSLSVEEQFYAGWPILMLALIVLAIRLRRRRFPVLALGLGAVVAASLAFSVQATASNPASAYFITPTRIWELGIGALLAVLLLGRTLDGGAARESVPLSLGARTAVAWLGLAAIGWSAYTYSAATPFPGWQALVPVLGTAAVLAARPGIGGGSPGGLLARRPVQWLGDASYSVYLWHWPMIVLLPYVSGGQLGLLDKGVVLVTTLVLAGLTKTYVEDLFRTSWWNGRTGTVYALGVAGMAIVVGLSALQIAEVDHRQEQAREDLARALAGDDPCFGAATLARPAQCTEDEDGDDVVPAPVQALTDKSQAYADVSGGRDCWSYTPSFPTKTCEFGDPAGTVSVALVGNSHAGHWLPALQEVADRSHWRITTYLASQCAMSETRQNLATDAHRDACLSWVERTSRRIAQDKPDLIVMSNRMSVAAEATAYDESGPLYEAGYRTVLQRWADAGVPVVVLRDTPAPGDADVDSVPDCVAAHLDDLGECSGKRTDWEPEEPAVAAVAAVGSPLVSLLDLNDRICARTQCAAVVGRVIVYFDGSHLTATYGRTLAPFLAPPLLDALARRTRG